MSNFQVLHIKPRLEVPSGLQRHIDRVQFIDGVATVWVPANADITRTAGNVELISRDFVKEGGMKTRRTIQQAIDKRLREAGIGHIKQKQYKCIEVMLSGSPAVLQPMPREKLLEWANDAVDWAKRQFGEENVVSANLHVDETTPHIHLFLVPIVSGKPRRTAKRQKAQGDKNERHRTYNVDNGRLRLCANEVFCTAKLYRYHDSLAGEVSKNYGMVRGIMALPGHKKKHMDSIEYNRQLQREIDEKKQIIADLSADYENELQNSFESTAKVLKDAALKTVENFDNLCRNEAADPTREEREGRDRLEREAKLEPLDAKEMAAHLSKLQNLIFDTTRAIERIGGALQKLAKNISVFPWKNLAREKRLQAQIQASEEKAENSSSEAEKAKEEAENAKNRAIQAMRLEYDLKIAELKAAEIEAKKRSTAALNREQAARDIEKKFTDLNTNLEQKITEAAEAARKEGIHIQHQKWLKWKEDTHLPVVTERNDLRSKVSDLESKLSNVKAQLQESRDNHTAQAVDTAKTLIRKWGAAPFEQAGLDFTEYGSWQTAKNEIAQERNVKQGGGVKMH